MKGKRMKRLLLKLWRHFSIWYSNYYWRKAKKECEVIQTKQDDEDIFSYVKRCCDIIDYTFRYTSDGIQELGDTIPPPALPATTLADGCYQFMFGSCQEIYLSDTQTGEYQTPYRIPTTGTGTDASWDATFGMFDETSGDFSGTPSINTTYYTSNTVV